MTTPDRTPYGHTDLCVERSIASMRKHMKPANCPTCTAFNAGLEMSEMQWVAFTQRLADLIALDPQSPIAVQIAEALQERA